MVSKCKVTKNKWNLQVFCDFSGELMYVYIHYSLLSNPRQELAHRIGWGNRLCIGHRPTFARKIIKHVLFLRAGNIRGNWDGA